MPTIEYSEGDHLRSDEAAARSDISEYAYRYLRTSILKGAYDPGETLSQVKLAAELGISRTPLREAIRRLVGEGLLVADFNRRIRVAETSLEDLDETFAVLLSLEALSLRLSIPYLKEAQLGKIQTAFTGLEKNLDGGQWDAFHASHKDLHLGMIVEAGARLRLMVAGMWDQSERYQRRYFRSSSQDIGDSMVDRYGVLVDAVIAGDLEEVLSCVTQQFTYTVANLYREVDRRSYPLAFSAVLTSFGSDEGRQLLSRALR